MLPHAPGIDSRHEHFLAVDYNKPVFDVYVDFAKYCIEAGLGLEILGYVCAPAASQIDYRPPPVAGEHAFPSWTPDWRIPNRIRPLNSTGLLHGEYRVLYDPCPKTKVAAVVSGLELGIQGFVFDTINSIVTTSGRQEIPVSNVLATWSAELASTYGPIEKERFWKLVLADAYQIESEETGLTANARGGGESRHLMGMDPASLDYAYIWVRSQMHHALRGVCRDRRAGYTEAKRLAILPEAAVPGDLVAAFHGGHTLYVVRPIAREEKYTFVGECYVEDMMDGEVMTLATENGIVPQTLWLV
ncbi:hypothetical protein DOTSEDRAFT_24489 [Dothistroma septosporum NZE10]|uniref:Heterokaryon incompatibility domain-containing protein n=1 Tax=Dothistroma septosporum (strain NZE10 / CBS 128990) TaxID=675120 RepID=N1PPV1_DOTSN|nr:hypothetical protein DOTSEDRAFT_24489 [Dothistroma septosporum NZE10]